MKTSKASKLKLPRRRLAPLAAIALGLAWGGTTAQAQGPRPGEARTVEGRVRALTTAPMGELDGATLDDGTTIHWPPHLADRFASVATKGDRVRVVGRTETGPEGDTHFEVQNLTNLRTNAAAEGEEGPPPPPTGVAPDPSTDFDAPPAARGRDLDRQLKQLEDRIAQLQEEIRRLRGGR